MSWAWFSIKKTSQSSYIISNLVEIEKIHSGVLDLKVKSGTYDSLLL